MALKVGELFASFNLDTSGVSSAVSSAEKQLGNLGKGMMIGGAAMTAAVTVPLKKMASEIYQAGSGFDAQMSKVFAIAGDSVTGSTEAMEALRAAALEMGSTTSFTASEAGEALQYMAMAGWKTDQMLNGLAPIMDLAAASGESLGTVSDIVTDALTAFGLTAADAAHFADVLAAASSNSNTNVSIMGESFKYVAPLAGTLGYSVDDVAVALGLMANAGIKGSMAGTSLRQVLSNLISPTKTQAAAMEMLGVSLYDSNGQVKDFATLMNDFRTAAKNSGYDIKALRQTVSELDGQLEAGTITQAEYDARIQELTDGNGDFLTAVSDLAGARGLSGLLAIMNATDEEFANLTAAVNGSAGAAKRMSKIMLENAQGDVTLFKSALEGLEITLWGLAENGFRKTVQEATKYVDAFRKADKETQTGTLLMAALAAATGPVMAGMGSVITLLPKLAHTFTAVSGPVALLALGLVALGAAAIDSNNSIGKTFVKGITKAGSKISQIGRNVKKQLPQLQKNMAAFLGSVSTGIKRGLPGIMNGIGDIATTGITALAANMGNAAQVSQTLITTLANGLKRNIPKLVPAAASLVTNLGAALISNAPKILSAGLSLFSTLADSILKLDWTNIGVTLRNAITGALSEIRTNFYTLVFGKEPTEKDLGDWGELGSKLVENIKAGIKQASDNGKNLLGGLVLGNDYDPGDSWGTVAGKIWNKITASMSTFLSNAGDLIKGLVLGKDYSADASWAQVGTAIWNKAKSGFDALTANAKDFIGTLVLGDNYSASDTWSTVGSAIWNKIKTGIAATGDWIKGLILGDAYQADEASWKAVGTAIWDKIKLGIKKTGDWLKELLGFTPDESWKTVGSSLWDKIKAGIDIGRTWATELLGKITSALSTLSFDAEDIQLKIQNAATFVGNLASALLEHKIENFTNIGTFVGNLVGGIADWNGWSSIGSSLGKTVGNLVQSIVEAIPDAVDAAGNALDVGLTLAGGLVDSIVSAFDSFDPDINISGIVSGLINKITELLPKAFELGGKVLSAGAHIANSIFSSIASALTNIEASGVGEKLGEAAKELVKKLLTIDLSTNTDVQGFMTNLGAGLRSAAHLVGNIAGAIVKHLTSREGAAQSFDAGAKLISFLWKGGLDFLANIGTGLADGIMGAFGYERKEVTEAREAARDWQNITLPDYGANNEFAQGIDDGIALLFDFDEAFITDMENAQKWADIISSAYNTAGASGPVNPEYFRELIEAQMDGAIDYALTGYDPNEFYEALAAVLGGAKSEIPFLTSANLQIRFDANSDDPLAAINEYIERTFANYPELLEYYKGQAASIFAEYQSEAAQTATEIAQETASSFDQAYDEIIGSEPEAGSLAGGMAGASEEAITAMETILANGVDRVSDAAATVSDAAVQQFLLTMSATNGTTIAETFIGAIITVMENGTLVTASTTLAQSSFDAVNGILTAAAGSGIGSNFGQGLANGISSMMDTVTTAATNLGNAATNALSSAIQEGSPSRITEESGDNFGLGFINHILSSIAAAEDAAEMLGAGATVSLADSVNDARDFATDGMSLPVKPRRSAEEAYAAESQKAAQQYAAAIAQSLNGARVVMDGEDVGRLVMPTVSELIASEAGSRRWGTE